MAIVILADVTGSSVIVFYDASRSADDGDKQTNKTKQKQTNKKTDTAEDKKLKIVLPSQSSGCCGAHLITGGTHLITGAEI